MVYPALIVSKSTGITFFIFTADDSLFDDIEVTFCNQCCVHAFLKATGSLENLSEEDFDNDNTFGGAGFFSIRSILYQCNHGL